MVPSGWKLLKLESIVSKDKYSMVDGPFGSNLKSEHYRISGINVLQSGFVTSGKFIAKRYVYVDQELFEQQKRSAAKSGDILMAKIGAQAGRCGIIPPSHPISIIAGNCLKLSFDDNSASTPFMHLALSWNYDRTGLAEIKTETAQPAISLKSLKSYKLLMPTLQEQRKIATIIGSWDKAINTTERLIDNSTQQKKSLMQQLLEGKKRLSGFDSEWKEIKLAEIGKCITGLTYSPSDIVNKDGMLVLRSSNVQHGKLSFKDNVFVNSDLKIKTKTQNGDILVCIRNGSKNLIGKSALIKGKAANQAHGAFMTLFRCKYPDYAFQLFQSSHYYRQVHKNLGATINSINTSDLHKFKFMMPTDDNETNAIAACLSNADREVEVLVQQLADLKQEKKALMQQLLTGKRRVLV